MPVPMLALVVASYFVGSIPFGYLVGRMKGVDVRKAGSGNIGATNVGRLFGRKYWWLVFSLDFLKGFVPMIVGQRLVSSLDDGSWVKYALWMSCAVTVILGHVFPIYLGFKGGKGVATSLGVMFGVFPYYSVAAVPAVLIFLAARSLIRIISVASMLGSAAFPIFLAIAGATFNWHLLGYRWPLLAVATVMAALVIYRHRANIARLRAGTEPRLS